MIVFGDNPTAEIRRRSDSWMFIYVALGFALSIEGTFLQMIEPLRFPYNLIFYTAFIAVTTWLFICNRWFQNKLIALKRRYKDKPL
jgi:uncharacterized membrane protein